MLHSTSRDFSALQTRLSATMQYDTNISQRVGHHQIWCGVKMVQLTFVVATLSPRHLLRCTLVAGVNPLSTFCPMALQLSQCTLVAGANPLCTFCTHGITSFTVHSGGWCKPSQHLRPMALHISHCIVCEPSQHLLYPWYCTWANVGTNIKLLTSDVALHAWLLQQQEDRSECGSHSGSHIKKLITTSYV